MIRQVNPFPVNTWDTVFHLEYRIAKYPNNKMPALQKSETHSKNTVSLSMPDYYPRHQRLKHYFQMRKTIFLLLFSCKYKTSEIHCDTYDKYPSKIPTAFST